MMLIILAAILPELIAISAIASESIVAVLPLSIAKVEIASEFYAMLIILSEILPSLA